MILKMFKKNADGNQFKLTIFYGLNLSEKINNSFVSRRDF